ncbi:hypothetical protein HC761_01980 [bacterium]|nr:hypothetical protein [bacterium]
MKAARRRIAVGPVARGSLQLTSDGVTALLAALPKAPSTLHPFRQRERATERRNYVIDRMVENGYVKSEDGDAAKKTPLSVTAKPTIARSFAGS